MLYRLPLAFLDDTAARSVRAALDTEHADRLAAAIKAGRPLPPVQALQDADRVLVYDGAHRLEGHRRASPLFLATLEVEVEITGEGGPRQALALALGCNQAHGLPLSWADLRHRRDLVLSAEEERVAGGAKRHSSRVLAAIIGCSHTFVSEWYAEQGIKTKRRKPAPPVRPEPGQQLIGGGEVPTDAALRDRLEARLTMAVHLGIETFDLDGSDEDVGSWCSDLDEEPRERIEAALAGVERAIEARRRTQNRPPQEIPCPTASPASSPPPSLTPSTSPTPTTASGTTTSLEPSTDGQSAPSTTGPKAGRTHSEGSIATFSTPTPEAAPPSPASPATTENDGDEDAMLGEALDEARERIKALEAQVADLGLREGIQHARADGWQRKAEIAQESADKLVSMQHRLDAAIDRERQAIARAERAEAGLTAAQRDAGGWPEGWTLDTMARLPCWRAPRDSDGHRGPSAVVYEVAGGGYEAAMETPDHDTIEGALELLRRMAWGLAGRPLAASEPEPAPSESLPAETPAASFTEFVMPYREPRWLAAVRGRLGAEPDEDVAWGAGPNVPTVAVRRERERLGIPEYVAPTPAPDPFALYRPWTRSADELAAHLEALPREDWEQVRQAFGVASGARIIERLTLRIMRDARAA